MIEERELTVRNKSYNKNEQDSQDNIKKNLCPIVKNELVPFNKAQTPLIIELNIFKTKLNIESECIEGYMKFKDINQIS